MLAKRWPAWEVVVTTSLSLRPEPVLVLKSAYWLVIERPRESGPLCLGANRPSRERADDRLTARRLGGQGHVQARRSR